MWLCYVAESLGSHPLFAPLWFPADTLHVLCLLSASSLVGELMEGRDHTGCVLLPKPGQGWLIVAAHSLGTKSMSRWVADWRTTLFLVSVDPESSLV